MQLPARYSAAIRATLIRIAQVRTLSPVAEFDLLKSYILRLELNR